MSVKERVWFLLIMLGLWGAAGTAGWFWWWVQSPLPKTPCTRGGAPAGEKPVPPPADPIPAVPNIRSRGPGIK